MQLVKYSVLILLSLIGSIELPAQCTSSGINYSTVEREKGDYDIYLTSDEGVKEVQSAEIVDLFTGKTVFEENQQFFLSKESRLIFSGINSSQYVIYLLLEQCEKRVSLGGIQGLKIGEF